jgi:FGGY-family pentulose kinase
MYFLTFDFGTESLRGALFNERGEMLNTACRPYTTLFPHPGWAEQIPTKWWEAFRQVIRTLLDDSGIGPERITALCIDSTSCTVLPLDSRFRPLRNALLWMDVRSFRQAARIAECGCEALKYNGYGGVSAEWMPSKALWLKENEPEIYNEACYLCELQDYINFLLTGEYVASINNVTIRWYYDAWHGGWPRDLYESVGLGEVIGKFPPRVLKMGEPIGRVQPRAAEETGLSRETMVIQGGADAFAGMLGMGAVKPDRLALITGSSHVLLGQSKEEFHRRGVFGAFPDAVITGQCTVEGSQISTGSVLKWFKDQFIGQEYEREAEKQGLNLYDYLSDIAREIKIGSDGLILLNYWQGNRNPVTDSEARGAVWGFSLKHTAAHLYRAIMEGIAYGTEYILRQFKEAGFEADGIYVCGGATNSELWMQIHADVMGLPMYLTAEPNAPLLGDAILASCGAGVYGSIEEAAGNMVRVRAKIEPDMRRYEAYRYYVDRYIETYTRMCDLMHDMLRHETS